MIVDPSAIVAIFLREPGFQHYLDAISRADGCRISAASFVELSMVMSRAFDIRALRESEEFFERTRITVESVTTEHARLASQAFLNFGKGRHPAGLNFGDCFSYALAKASGETLLFKGDDFNKTDLMAAVNDFAP